MHAYNEFDPLKLCIIGSCYTKDHAQGIPDPKVRDSMARIFDETCEDLQGFSDLLNKHGVEVLRPELPMSVDQFVDASKQRKHLPIPPLHMRDWIITLDDTTCFFHHFDDDFNIKRELASRGQKTWLVKGEYDPRLDGSCIARLGRDIIFDSTNFFGWQGINKIIKGTGLDVKDRFKLHTMDTDGHCDGVFAAVNPGVLITTYHVDDSAYDMFKGWKRYNVHDPSTARLHEFKKFSEANGVNGRYFVGQLDEPSKFAYFVDTYLSDWVGYVAETVFEVNCLVIDRKNIVVSNHHPVLWKMCDENGITPHIVRLRHKWFFDGGLHCFTSDVHREGVLESYI